MISVVIPTRNDAARLGPCLAALMPGLSAGVLREVIFADAASTDATAVIAEETGARLVPAPRGGGAQMAAGAAAARGPWLLVLLPDAVLPDGWAMAAQRHIAAHGGRAAWFPERPGAGARWRSRLIGLPGHARALLVSLAEYRGAGGFRDKARAPLPDLARRLGRARLAALDAGPWQPR